MNYESGIYLDPLSRIRYPVSAILYLIAGILILHKIPTFVTMEVNDALIDKLAHLSRLQFEAGEKEQIKEKLQSMIAFVEKLNELDTTGVEPLLHMSENSNVLREDELKGSISRSEGLQNAPLKDEHFFKVPKVIKK